MIIPPAAGAGAVQAGVPTGTNTGDSPATRGMNPSTPLRAGPPMPRKAGVTARVRAAGVGGTRVQVAVAGAAPPNPPKAGPLTPPKGANASGR